MIDDSANGSGLTLAAEARTEKREREDRLERAEN
jgi:hypothetical protein